MGFALHAEKKVGGLNPSNSILGLVPTLPGGANYEHRGWRNPLSAVSCDPQNKKKILKKKEEVELRDSTFSHGF